MRAGNRLLPPLGTRALDRRTIPRLRRQKAMGPRLIHAWPSSGRPIARKSRDCAPQQPGNRSDVRPLVESCYQTRPLWSSVCAGYEEKDDQMRKLINRLYSADEGAALAEYGLLVGLIAVVCVVAITALGTQISTVFSEIASAI